LEENDSWVWKDGEFLIFTVNSACNCLRRAHEGENVFVYKKFWRSKVVPSALVFTWRVLENKIATRINLERRKIAVKSLLCGLCGLEEETCRHLFFECIIVSSVWSLCFALLGVTLVSHNDPLLNFFSLGCVTPLNLLMIFWEQFGLQ